MSADAGESIPFDSKAVQLENGCLLCGKVTNGYFCGQACTFEAERNAPLLIEVHHTHNIFKSVATQFNVSWLHSTLCPTVHHIYKVIAHSSSTAEYEAYKASVEALGKFVSSGKPAGNEKHCWHGTTRKCLIGDNGNTALCSSGSCSLCEIIRVSYKLDVKPRGWYRFGKGIYTSSVSSKCNDYAKNTEPSEQKALLFNNVVVGTGYRMTQNYPSMTAPPRGYDSVLGKPGSALNYDEIVCYTESAIRPSYLVIYDAKSVEHAGEYSDEEHSEACGSNEEGDSEACRSNEEGGSGVCGSNEEDSDEEGDSDDERDSNGEEDSDESDSDEEYSDSDYSEEDEEE